MQISFLRLINGNVCHNATETVSRSSGLRVKAQPAKRVEGQTLSLAPQRKKREEVPLHPLSPHKKKEGGRPNEPKTKAMRCDALRT